MPDRQRHVFVIGRWKGGRLVVLAKVIPNESLKAAEIFGSERVSELRPRE